MPRRVTVVVLNDYCHVNGGASRIAVDEAVGLAAAGHEVIFLGATGPVCEELQHSGAEVVCLNQPELLEAGRTPSVMVQGLWNRAAAKAMGEILDRCDPVSTVVHLHGYTKSLSTSPVRVAARRGFRVVCTLHDFFAACPNGAFFDYTSNSVCRRGALSVACIGKNCDKRHYVHKLYRVLRSFMQKGVGCFPDSVKAYISLSRQSEALLRAYLPRDARLFPLENLIEANREPPVDVAINSRIVVVGRLDQEKGVELLLEAVARAGIALTFVGDGPLRELAERTKGVRVTGWLSNAEVRAELRQARCLVFPSLWYETYGLVVGEAASCGVPAIVSDVTAAAERVTDGVEGWHSRSGDVEDLVRCLLLTKDDAKVRAAGRAAYRRFWSNPPVRSNHLRDLEAIYEAVLA